MASASFLFAATGLGSVAQVKPPKLFVKSSLDTSVSDMSVNGNLFSFHSPLLFFGKRFFLASFDSGFSSFLVNVSVEFFLVLYSKVCFFCCLLDSGYSCFCDLLCVSSR